jgi:ATP-dependent helicase/nuclease subunit A
VLETSAERLSDPRDPEAARKEGIALHALLQHLSHIDPVHWDAVSARALPTLLPDSADHAAVLTKARSILARPELAHLFGPDSRGEVPILAQGTRNKAPITIAGRIDRLVVKPGRVLIVDYKSDANPPGTQSGVPAAYLTQLGIYALVAQQLFPGQEIEAAILWTSLETFMNLSQATLREAVAGFTVG